MPLHHKIKLHSQASLLELTFNDGFKEMLSFEMLRVHSPAIASHDRNKNLLLLVTNKAYVKLDSIKEVSEQGLHLRFDDGHDGGVFDWSYLYQLAKNQDLLWSSYLKRLTSASRLKQYPLRVIVDYQPQH